MLIMISNSIFFNPVILYYWKSRGFQELPLLVTFESSDWDSYYNCLEAQIISSYSITPIIFLP